MRFALSSQKTVLFDFFKKKIRNQKKNQAQRALFCSKRIQACSSFKKFVISDPTNEDGDERDELAKLSRKHVGVSLIRRIQPHAIFDGEGNRCLQIG